MTPDPPRPPDDAASGAANGPDAGPQDPDALRAVLESIDLDALQARAGALFDRRLGEVAARFEHRLRAERRRIAELQRELRHAKVRQEQLARELARLRAGAGDEPLGGDPELFLEVLPPGERRLGVAVTTEPEREPVRVDCEARLPVCRAACCRLFKVHLTEAEVLARRYRWDPDAPYALTRRRGGACSYLRADCGGGTYAARPQVCRTYDCSEDARIWADFEGRVLQERVAKRLAALGPAEGDELPAMDGGRAAERDAT